MFPSHDRHNIYIDGLSIYDNTADRGPYFIESDNAAEWNNVIIKNLRWINSVGKTTYPYSAAGSTNIFIEFIPEPYRVNRTGNLTLSSRFSNFVLFNIGTVAQIVFTLPAVAAGMRFVFENMDTDGIKITPNASDRLWPYATADAKYMDTTEIGASAVVYANQDASDWIVKRFGTWTDEP